jgi:hypothetical protein
MNVLAKPISLDIERRWLLLSLGLILQLDTPTRMMIARMANSQPSPVGQASRAAFEILRDGTGTTELCTFDVSSEIV